MRSRAEEPRGAGQPYPATLATAMAREPARRHPGGMTSYATNITPLPAAPTRDRTGPTVALIGGSITAFFALLLILAGSALLWADHHEADGDGYYTSASHTYSTPTRALVSDDLDVGGDIPGWLNTSDRLGRVRIDPQGAGSFVGVARTRDVNAYLDGVARDEVTDLDLGPFHLDTARHAGEGRPAVPGAQTIWAASSTDGRPLEWKVREGEWTVVMMNADGSPGVHVDATLGAKLPLIGSLGWGLAIPGIALGLASVALIALGARGLARTD